MPEQYIRFDFTSVKKQGSMQYYVLAENMTEMQQFLSQHGFHDVNDALKLYSGDKYRASNCSHILKTYRFMSNHKPGVFPVMTCASFVDHAIESAANDLGDHSIFGEAILRQDIEFIKMIGSAITKLPHGYVMDYILADESTLFECLENGGTKRDMIENTSDWLIRHSGPSEDPTSQTILQSLYDATPDLDNDYGVYPITVEAYVSYFTELMIDCYN